jgi:two-component system nitrate/nitrite sensor histidine kinase NarX
LAAAVVMVYTGYLYVINPLGQLRQGCASSSRAILPPASTSTPRRIRPGGGRLQPHGRHVAILYEGLEAQVLAKTQRVEAQRARLEALYEVSAFLASATPSKSCPRVFAAGAQGDEGRRRGRALGRRGQSALPDAGVRLLSRKTW